MCLTDSPKSISARTSTPLNVYSLSEPTTHRQFGSREELPGFSPLDYGEAGCTFHAINSLTARPQQFTPKVRFKTVAGTEGPEY